MNLSEIQERLDFLLTEVYNRNTSLDDARDEIEYELKEFMSKEFYSSSIKQLDDIEEQMFQQDWRLVDWQ